MMRASRSALAFVLASGLAGSHPLLIGEAHAVVVCQRGKRVKLRASECKKKETRVGLDADTLQGRTPDQLTPSAQQTLDALKAVDGPGSGLDADTIQGASLDRIVGSAESLRILRGSIFGDGSIETGTGFTAARLATGQFRIDISEPFSGFPMALYSPICFGCTTVFNGGTEASLEVRFGDPAYVDPFAFHFILIGPR